MAIPPPEQPSLTVLSGPLAGTAFIVDDSVDTVLVGSDPSCRFALPGTAVDPIHARLWIDLEGITVYDTDSPGGVYINDDRVQGQARLRNGDILWLGTPGNEKSVMLQCRIPDPSSPAPVVPRAATPAVVMPEADEPDSTVAMMAIDLEPTMSLMPEPVVMAPDAIQPEPTVMLSPGDDEVLAESEPTVSMLPDDLEISEDAILPDETISLQAPIAAPSPTLVTGTGWDAGAGGIPASADPPWLQAAPPVVLAPVADLTMANAAIGDVTMVDATVAEAPAVKPRDPAPVAAVPARKAAATQSGAASSASSGARAEAPAVRPVVAPKPSPARAPAAKPRREPPAATPPPRRREPPPPAQDMYSPPPARKGAPMGLLIGGGLVAAAAVAAGGWWMLTRSSAAPEGQVAPPPTVADAGARPTTRPPAVATGEQPRPETAVDVPVEEETTIVPLPRPGMSPSAIPSRAPVATPPPAQAAAAPPVTAAPAGPAPAVVAAGMVGRAETARRAGDLDAAAELFDEALRADPGNAAATSGKAAIASARVASRKAFMPGRTVVQTQSAKADMAGFDTADVSVKKAPDFSGRIEFAVNPARVKPGDNYAVQIYLVNEGKKAIKVSGVALTTNLNGTKSARPGTARVKEVAPSQRALLDEIPGVWPEEVTWWSTEVLVTANKGDTLKNLLTWK